MRMAVGVRARDFAIWREVLIALPRRQLCDPLASGFVVSGWTSNRLDCWSLDAHRADRVSNGLG